MDIWSLLIFLLVGAVAGWLAGLLVKGGGFGLPGDIVIGVVGAVVGGFVFTLLGLEAAGIIGSLVSATVGAIIFLALVRAIKRA